MNPVYITIVVLPAERPDQKLPRFVRHCVVEEPGNFVVQLDCGAMAVFTFRVHPIDGSRLFSGFMQDPDGQDRMTLTVPYHWRDSLKAEIVIAYGDWLTKVFSKVKPHGENETAYREDF